MPAVMRNTKRAVPATLDGTPLMLLVDTGSSATVLNSRVVKQAERTSLSGTLRGIGGSRDAQVAMLQKLQIGRLFGASLPAIATEFDPNLAKAGFAGVLGMDIMGAYDVDIDTPGSTLRLYTAHGACRGSRAVLDGTLYAMDELPPIPNDPRPHIKVGIDGQQLDGLLDTGSEGLLISGRTARQLGITDDSLRGDRALTIGGIGRHQVTGHVHILQSVTLGDLSIHRVPALVVPENYDSRVDVIIGMDLFTRIHFWLSNSSRRIVMQYPPQPSPAR